MFDILINGIPLTAVILAFVEWLKSFGVAGNALRASSLVVGLILGGAYQYSVAAPVDFASWLGLVVYGLALGLVASGFYDAAKSATSK